MAFCMSSAAALPLVRSVSDLRKVVAGWRAEGLRVGFVPTMGALHEGHLSLVRTALQHADRVIASVFVNPTQFAPTEDLDRYPRQEATDAELLASAGCGLMFAPRVSEMYPEGFSTEISVGGPAEGLETEFRPQMFGGVAVVVTKLLNQVTPDVAVFGEKDYQQFLVIKRLVRDLDLPISIIAGATVREPDGLALSSRNAYLSPGQREVAATLNVTLSKAAERARAGDRIPAIEAAAYAEILAAGFDAVDYVAIRRAEDLRRFASDRVDAPARVLTAARIGATRLIDNTGV
jgi:pantoate--beta-alanine ligase